jgi:hypothetical protein
MALSIMALALVIGIVPQVTKCASMAAMGTGATTMSSGSSMTNGSSMTGSTGMNKAATTPVSRMKCYWTARAEIAVAVPLFAVGLLMFVFARRNDAVRVLGVSSFFLGIAAILLPTALIGVCQPGTAICREAMRPSMIAAGGLVVAVSLIAIVVNEVRSVEAVGLQTRELHA